MHTVTQPNAVSRRPSIAKTFAVIFAISISAFALTVSVTPAAARRAGNTALTPLPPVVRDHRVKPEVRDHRRVPMVRDHRSVPCLGNLC